jgi:ferredoxin
MVRRKIITIDESKCNGCGVCIPNCPEGALQIIDGKARLISDIFCDGLGACIGNCPQGAIGIEEREADLYDEKKTMKNIVKAGKNTIIAHLRHLKDHDETAYLKEALDYLKENNIDVDFQANTQKNSCASKSACPGSLVQEFSSEPQKSEESGIRQSDLKQWPVQFHLLPANAPFFKRSDMILVADCVAYAIGDFHKEYLKGKTLAIACPKLDSNLDNYLEKIISLIDDAEINTLTVITMQVPCCSGLLGIAKKASEKASRKIPIKSIVISIKGEKLKEEWI